MYNTILEKHSLPLYERLWIQIHSQTSSVRHNPELWKEEITPQTGQRKLSKFSTSCSFCIANLYENIKKTMFKKGNKIEATFHTEIF